jgi:hypothetical protein
VEYSSELSCDYLQKINLLLAWWTFLAIEQGLVEKRYLAGSCALLG